MSFRESALSTTRVSDEALRVAMAALDVVDGRKWAGASRSQMVTPALHAAHPIIKAEVIAEIVEVLRAIHDQPADVLPTTTWRSVADFIEKRASEGKR